MRLRTRNIVVYQARTHATASQNVNIPSQARGPVSKQYTSGPRLAPAEQPQGIAAEPLLQSFLPQR